MTPITPERVGGAVLCGGESSRMGRPKAWLPFAGESMLARVVRLLREAVGRVVVVAAPEQELPPLPADIIIVRDAERGRGPMQGLAAALAACECEALYVSSCDVPLLGPAFVRRMASLLGDHLIAVPDVAGRRHPLAAVYRAGVLPVALRLLAEGRGRMTALFDEVPTRFVGEAELTDAAPGMRSLRNVNTPAEYEAALAEVAAAPCELARPLQDAGETGHRPPG